jgi:hypothetical protein
MPKLLPTRALAGLIVLLTCVGSLASLTQSVMWWPMVNGEDPVELAAAFDLFVPLMVLGTFGKGLGAWLLLPVWFGMQTGNLRRLGVVGLTFTPAQAWYSFYLPVLNVFRRYTALKEIWHASDPGLASGQRYDGSGWLTTERTPLLTVFWVAWVASWALLVLAPWYDSDTVVGLRLVGQPFLEAVSVAALVFLMVQIERRLGVMQTALSEGPSLRSALGHTPTA